MGRKLIVCGSPRKAGRSNHIANALFEQYANAGDEVELFLLAEHPIAPCTACDACEKTYTCIIDDDMQLLYPLLDETDDLILVSPVYFSGPPAQFKAVLDRFQPYFWKAYAPEGRAARRAKRPVTLYVIGQGGDPHGFDPLIGCVRSATAVAGFSLECVYNCVGLSDGEFDEAFAANTLVTHPLHDPLFCAPKRTASSRDEASCDQGSKRGCKEDDGQNAEQSCVEAVEQESGQNGKEAGKRDAGEIASRSDGGESTRAGI